jgi:hypothetical protein
VGEHHEGYLRTIVRGHLNRPPEFARRIDSVGVCSLLVVWSRAGGCCSPYRVADQSLSSEGTPALAVDVPVAEAEGPEPDLEIDADT